MWVGDRTLSAEQKGVLVLGSPVGTLAYAEECSTKKLEEELTFLKASATDTEPAVRMGSAPTMRSIEDKLPLEKPTVKASGTVRSHVRHGSVVNAVPLTGRHRLVQARKTGQQSS